jgi:hypothetical protein
VNQDAHVLGFGELNLPFEIAETHGFPICEAEIEYDGPGYRATMGWIQVVTVDALAPDQFSGAAVDTYPAMWASDSPFVTFGHRPGIFDAPGPNPPRTDEMWSAETFLAVCGDVARQRTVQALLGFRWGYRLASGRATSEPLETASESDWRRCVAILKAHYPNWDFETSFLRHAHPEDRQALRTPPAGIQPELFDVSLKTG